MTVCVVGGSGFVGTRLCGRFASQGVPFRIIDKVMGADYPAQTTIADICDLDALSGALTQCDALIHLAAVHRDDVRPLRLYEDVNVDGTRNVCAAAERAGIDRIIFTSSVACYGFAAPNTDEGGAINPFNEYGRTKAAAEQVLREWQLRDPGRRSLVIIRPTVIFGERNRGNVYNLFRQIHDGRFAMVGGGNNVKSMAYVENVAAFIQFLLGSPRGVSLHNYVDKPDMSMNDLVALVREKLGRGWGVGPRLPYAFGLLAGYAADVLARMTGRSLPISSIRVRKFCATTQFSSNAEATGFKAPARLRDGIERTLQFEFIDKLADATVFYTE